MSFQIDQNELNDLIDACWAHHAWVKEFDKGNHPSVLPSIEMPILWFGNLKAYERSERRIITVGLNPSEMEFRERDTEETKGGWSMRRFQKANEIASIDRIGNESDLQHYRDALDDYFLNASAKGKKGKTKTAFMRWFSNWNGILHSLDASFDPEEMKNTAIHTDFCTPIATTPNWGELTDETAKKTIADSAANCGLWKGLVSVLQPDVILTCIASSYVEDIIGSLGLKVDDLHNLTESTCPRSPARKTLHAVGKLETTPVHLFAAPAGTPWRGWYKCQIEDFAKLIGKTVW